MGATQIGVQHLVLMLITFFLIKTMFHFQEITLAEKLGEGDGGVIYHAHWRGLDVVAKMLKADTDRCATSCGLGPLFPVLADFQIMYIGHAHGCIKMPHATARASATSEGDIAKADLINEISVLSRLRHPNVRSFASPDCLISGGCGVRIPRLFRTPAAQRSRPPPCCGGDCAAVVFAVVAVGVVAMCARASS
jgi:hypothetical protein